jgi:hypothetical protein
VGSIQQSGFGRRHQHEDQGSSPRLECPVNLSQVLAPDARNCQIKTTPHVEKKDLLESDCRTVTLLGSECSSLAEMGSGLYRRGQAMGEEESL